MRIELTTSSLPRKCSTTELQRRLSPTSVPAGRQVRTWRPHSLAVVSGRRGSNPRPIAWKAIALPTELLPHNSGKKLTNPFQRVWAGVDSNHWSRKTADLQSAPFGRSGTCPLCFSQSNDLSTDGAREGTRTPDQLITNQLLYQLSYSGLYRLEKLILTYLPGKVDM